MGKYVASDTHFNHENIIKYCNRPFSSVEEMNLKLIDNWNSVIKPEDTVFFLGDFCLGGKEDIINIGSKLNGHKVMIMGNHDKGTATTYKAAGFETVYKKPAIIYFPEEDITIEFSHAPKDSEYFNIHGHMHDNGVNDEKHYCACLEMNDYKPIPLNNIIKYFKGEK